jgi:hypothetical protein
MASGTGSVSVSFQPDLSKDYYVVIGMGFSALVNHRMLRTKSGEERVGKLPILHIGDADLWALCHRLKMGQWACLLTLPAFDYRPSNPPVEDFLFSDEFSGVCDKEWSHLAGQHPFYAIRASVQSIARSNSGFEIGCDGGRVVRAKRIDVCGGSGPPRLLEPGQVKDPQLWNEYCCGSVGPGGWPRLLTGEMFLNRFCGIAPQTSLVAVCGGGPTAAWCVECAQEKGYRVLWISREPLNAAFVPSGRNDSLAQGDRLIRTWKSGILVVDEPLYPSGCRTRFAEGIEIDEVGLSGSTVELRLKAYQYNPNPRYVDRDWSGPPF